MRRKNNNVMLNSNIATGFYATEFSVKDSVRETEKYILSKNMEMLLQTTAYQQC